MPKVSNQLYPPDEIHWKPEILELFSDFQLYAWCAQAVASLEVRSHKEDRFGIAQLSGTHTTVLSTLLSCLLAVETFMGKKVNLQSPNHMPGSAGIKWATNSMVQRGVATAMIKQRGSSSYLKSYALADVLKTSVYSIVSEFHEEMLASSKLRHLEKDWVDNCKLCYGSVELLTQTMVFSRFSSLVKSTVFAPIISTPSCVMRVLYIQKCCPEEQVGCAFPRSDFREGSKKILKGTG